MADTATLRMLASEYNVEYVDLEHFNTDKSMASLLTEDFARHHGVVPIGKKFGAPVIAVADPSDVFMMEELKAAIDREFVTVVVDREQIAAYQDSVYAANGTEVVTGGGGNEFAAADSEGDFNDPLTNALDNALGSSIFSMAFSPDANADAEEDASTDAGAGDAGLVTQTSGTFVADWQEVADATSGGNNVIVGIGGQNGQDLNISADGYGDGIHFGAEDGVYDGAMNGSGNLTVEDTGAGSKEIEDNTIAPVVPITSGVDLVADGGGDPGTETAEVEIEPESTGRSRKGRGKHVEGIAERQLEKTSASSKGAPTQESDHEAVLDEGRKDAKDAIAPMAGVADAETEASSETAAEEVSETTSRRSSRRANKRVAAVEPEEVELSALEEVSQLESEAVEAEDSGEEAGDSSITRLDKGAARPESSETGEKATADSKSAKEESRGSRSSSALDEALKGLAGEMPDIAGGDLSSLPPLARILVESGRVKQEEMVSVLAEHDATGQTVARVLSARGLVTEADLMWGLAQEMGLEFVDLDIVQVDINIATKLSDSTCRHHNILLIGYEDGKYVVAMSNPTDVFAIDDIRSVLGRNFKTVVATRSQISRYIERTYTHGGSADVAAQRAAVDVMTTAGEEAPERETEIQAVTEDAPVVRYVNLLILQALNERASDIHVEPTHDSLRIRYRIDGVLHDMQQAPLSLLSAVATRLKVMGDLNVAEHRVPQDGRISVSVGGRTIDLRIATIPTVYGEKVVMRVLDKSEVVLDLGRLGCEPDFLEKYRDVFRRPYGTIFVTGPTGSGKTTTLYATLGELNSPEKNIITVEDPVELRIMGINQVQTNVKAGLTFASALRSMLRCDPDIVMVGEVRDRDTALISVEAALTGHLVLATMHTNDVSRTPMRLVEMGIEPYLVASALTAVVAQRLVRQLCVHCKEEFEPTADEIIGAGWKPDEVYAESESDKITMYKPVGCPACSKTGYRGREAIYELMVADDELERLVTSGGSAEQIQDLAIQKGMTTLRQAGLRKVLKGETTLEEVLRVVV